jgi:hypothetical protein
LFLSLSRARAVGYSSGGLAKQHFEIAMAGIETRTHPDACPPDGRRASGPDSGLGVLRGFLVPTVAKGQLVPPGMFRKNNIT